MARERQREFNRLTMPIPEGKPDKRARRDLMRLRGRGQGTGECADDDPMRDSCDEA